MIHKDTFAYKPRNNFMWYFPDLSAGEKPKDKIFFIQNNPTKVIGKCYTFKSIGKLTRYLSLL
jgi:hypothetical protein